MDFESQRVRAVVDAVRQTTQEHPPRRVYMALVSALQRYEEFELVAQVHDAAMSTRWEVLSLAADNMLVALEAEHGVAKWRMEDGDGHEPDSLSVAVRPLAGLVAAEVLQVIPTNAAWDSDHAWCTTWRLTFSDGRAITLTEPDHPRAQQVFSGILDRVLQGLG